MKRILTAGVGLLALAGSIGAASAADLGRRYEPAPQAPVVVPPPVFTWTGFYIGANLGYGWSDIKGNLNGIGRVSGNGDGVVGGGQIGYNWQMGSFVVGLETDFQGSSGSGDVRNRGGGNILNATAETPWFGTVRGRVGYAMNQWLFYVTGGGAYGESTLKGRLNGVAFNRSKDYWTWTVGGGVEAALNQNWSVKAEYLYLGTPDSVALPPGTRAKSGDINSNIIRVGVNYHF